jgi:bacillithiol biosynthesis deacetylase BshB1
MKVDILAIGVHPDDVELSCAGTLIAQADQGYSFGLLDLTRGELGTRGTVAIRNTESAKSAELMGAGFRQNLDFADGKFVHDAEHVTKVIEVIRWCRPTLVLANAVSDRHPDHGRAAKLVADACYYAGLRQWKTTFDGQDQDAHRPKQLLHYIQDYFHEPDLVVDITVHIEAKLDCIRAFKSQFHDPESKEPDTPLTGEDFLPFIKARAREMGRPAGYTFAEGFLKSRRIGVKDLLTIA